MPQISFTKNNQQVYDRFSRLLLEEQLKRGKLTAPQFLDLVLEGYELILELQETQEKNPDQVIVLGLKDKVSVGDSLDVIAKPLNETE